MSTANKITVNKLFTWVSLLTPPRKSDGSVLKVPLVECTMCRLCAICAALVSHVLSLLTHRFIVLFIMGDCGITNKQRVYCYK